MKLLELLILITIILVVFLGGPIISIYQYHICRQQVCKGDGCFWYCIQHAK